MSASFPDPRWELIEPTLEELVLAYLDPDAIADARHALSEASR
jgi:hypothetical protein